MGKYLLDASVLIDLLEANDEILKLAAAKTDGLFILEDTISRVKNLDLERTLRLGLRIIKADLSQYDRINPESPLAEDDQLNIINAAELDLICVANDNPMHRKCDELGVPHIWGFELLLELAGRGVISRERAGNAGKLISQFNIKVTDDVYRKFTNRLKKL